MNPSDGDIFWGEIIGTGLLTLFGNGVVAAVLLGRTKGHGAGWVAITFGWGFAVLAGVYAAAPLSGGHINPAVTLGLAIDDAVEWDKVWIYIVGQLIGAFLGAVFAWLVYLGQFQANRDPVLGIFSTGPEIRNLPQNFITELIATFALVFVVLTTLPDRAVGLAGAGGVPLIVALLVVGIGLSLGSPTGYAINPARDLGPRVAHAVLPIPGKGSSDWGYALVPILGPLAGGALAALLARGVF